MGLSMVVLVLLVGVVASVEGLKMEVFHKFSAKAVEAMRERHGEEYGADWPAEGTIAFQTMLRDHDVHRHTGTQRRMLAATSADQYVFSQGNATEQLFGGGCVHFLSFHTSTKSTFSLLLHPTGLFPTMQCSGWVNYFSRSALCRPCFGLSCAISGVVIFRNVIILCPSDLLWFFSCGVGV